MKTLVASLLLLLSLGAVAQTGTVKGKVINSDSKEPEMFVPVYFTVSGASTTTNENGEFTIEVGSGRDTVKISPAIGDAVLTPVVIKANQVNNLEFAIGTQLKDSSGNDLQIVRIVHVVTKEGDKTADVEETKESETTTTVVGSQAMEEKAISDAEEGAKSATGVSSASRMIFVRGLGDRYNQAYLNGLPMPSPDPDFRVIPLDLFPSDVLSSIAITKTSTPEFYGDYAGGAIDMRTTSPSSTPFLKVGVSGGINTMSTGKDFLTYNGGKTDYFGFDNGVRSIPSFVNTKSLEKANQYFPQGIYRSIEGEGTGFSNDNNPIRTSAMPKTGFNLSGGKFWKFDSLPNSKDPDGFGILFNAAHDAEQVYSEGRMAIINANNAEKLDYEVYNYTKNMSSSALLALNGVFRNGKDKINLNIIGLNLASDQSRETYGFHFDYTDTAAGTNNIFTRRYTFKQNTMGAAQLMGEHSFLKHDRLQFNWAGHYATARSNEPDRRQFVWFYDTDQREQTDSYTINATDVNENHRFFSYLTENEIDAKAEVEFHAIQKLKDTTLDYNMLTVRAGFDYKDKTRDFDYRQFNYKMSGVLGAFSGAFDVEDPDRILNDANHDNGLFYIDELANPGSAYVATLNVMAPYAAVKFQNENLTVVGGLRAEMGQQSIVNRNQQTPQDIDVNKIEGIEFIPSLNTKLVIDTVHQVRFSASRTITRPKFNEMAPFQYILYFAGTKAEGNPNLVNGTNYNADLGYGWFNRSGAMVNVGTFYKYLQNPVEMTMKGTASGQLQSFQNAEKAHVAGAELEIVQDLRFFAPKEMRDMPENVWKDFAVSMNAAYMWTQVLIDSTSGSLVNTNYIRPLEGASPWLANVGLSYNKVFMSDRDSITGRRKTTRIMAGLSYGSFGRRLSAVGVQGIGDQYEMPVHTLNATMSVEFNNRIKVGITAKNLLNANVRVVQENSTNPDAAPFTVNEYKKGVNLGMSVSYKILNGSKKRAKK